MPVAYVESWQEIIDYKKALYEYQGRIRDQDCIDYMESHGQDPDLCYLKHVSSKFVGEGVFVMMGQLDSKIFLDKYGIPHHPLTLDTYIEYYDTISEMRKKQFEALQELHQYYPDSFGSIATCDNTYHGRALAPGFNTEKVDGISNREALSAWYFDGKDVALFDKKCDFLFK